MKRGSYDALPHRKIILPGEKVAGVLEVERLDGSRRIVITHPDLKPDPNGRGSIVLSLRHARHLANLLILQAEEAEAEVQDSLEVRDEVICRSSIK